MFLYKVYISSSVMAFYVEYDVTAVLSIEVNPVFETPQNSSVFFTLHEAQFMMNRFIHSRSFSSRRVVSRSFIGGLLKIRYILMGSAVGGGISLKYRYEEWKSNMPDLSWIKELTSDVSGRMREMRALQNVDFDPLLARTKDQIGNLSTWFNKRLEQAKSYKELHQQLDKDVEKKSLTSEIQSALNLNIIDGRKSSSSPDNSDQNKLKMKLEESREELLKTQIRYQKKIESLEKENRELKKQLLLLKRNQQNNSSSVKETRKSLIDMYSDVLDELSGYDQVSYNTGDCLPRVVVIGDQSAGKTSVLEMIAQARIFPRGAGEMMTRSPVSVTLSEGPYHVARFKDSSREYDLTNEKDLSELRSEVERRMWKSVEFGGETISKDPISMMVQGPGLQRMVLVDLPGIISTVTSEMNPKTKEKIKTLALNYMSNPNAIILCIQDGSVDAERSNVVDLVSEMDPLGKRTLLVLTKVDLAEKNNISPERIKKILSGQLLPLKALGYYAVVTGGADQQSISAIKQHEQDFFSRSKLFQNETEISPSQMSTSNLSFALSNRFWSMVQDTIEQQADAFRAARFNLEAEWKNKFPRLRELDRDELFEKGKSDILDEMVNLSLVPARHWEDILTVQLWKNIGSHVLERIYIPASRKRLSREDSGAIFNTLVDIQLKEWAENDLGHLCVQVGWQVLSEEFKKLMNSHNEDIFKDFKSQVVLEAIQRHKWEVKAPEALRILQLNTLEDNAVPDKEQWNASIHFLESAIKEQLRRVKETLKDEIGPSTLLERYVYWKSGTLEQEIKRKVHDQLLVSMDIGNSLDLSEGEVQAVQRNLSSKGLEVDDSKMVRDLWALMRERSLLEKSLLRAVDSRKSFFAYTKGISTDDDGVSDVILFWRVQRMLKVTANALRQQLVNREAKRFEKEVKDVLDEYSGSLEMKKRLLKGRRVQLAEDLKRVRMIQDKLDRFIEALNAGRE